MYITVQYFQVLPYSFPVAEIAQLKAYELNGTTMNEQPNYQVLIS
jgi:hypothetical protein